MLLPLSPPQQRQWPPLDRQFRSGLIFDFWHSSPCDCRQPRRARATQLPPSMALTASASAILRRPLAQHPPASQRTWRNASRLRGASRVCADSCSALFSSVLLLFLVRGCGSDPRKRRAFDGFDRPGCGAAQAPRASRGAGARMAKRFCCGALARRLPAACPPESLFLPDVSICGGDAGRATGLAAFFFGASFDDSFLGRGR